MLTANLAIALAKSRSRTIILDGCFQFGDIQLVMNLQSAFTVKDALELLDQMDDTTLIQYLSRHESGVKILPAPSRPEYADLITLEVVSKITELLTRNTDFLLVDTMAGLSEYSLYFTEKADHILLVTDLEMATLKNTKLMLETFNTLGLREKVQIVVNRSTMKSVIKPTDVPHILGEEGLLYIPNDFEIVSKSVNIGIPFMMEHRRADISKDILNLASLFSLPQEQIGTRAKGRGQELGIFRKLIQLKERVE